MMMVVVVVVVMAMVMVMVLLMMMMALLMMMMLMMKPLGPNFECPEQKGLLAVVLRSPGWACSLR